MKKQNRDAIAGAVGLLGFMLAIACCIAFVGAAVVLCVAVSQFQWRPAAVGLLAMACAFVVLVCAVRAVHWVWDR